jgi:hypothetical protein
LVLFLYWPIFMGMGGFPLSSSLFFVFRWGVVYYW